MYEIQRPLSGVARGLCSIGTLLLVIGLTTGQAMAQSPSMSARAADQIALLMQEKQSRTEIQNKLDSRLLYEIYKRQDASPLHASDQLRQLQTGVEIAEDGSVLTDIRADVTTELLAFLESSGATIVNAHPRFEALRAHLPFAGLMAAAEHPSIHSIRPADYMMRQMTNTTEGDVAHATDVARVNFNIDGSGVQVGAMSDSVDALADLQASGDLPPGVTVLPGQSGNPGSSEGTALMEIIHDMAPAADLFFATGVGGEAQMAQNILDLAAAGCDVIVDDILYLGEAVFQDGIIAQAVDQVVSQGVHYYSSAGNSGNFNKGTAGVWEGDYVATALPAPLNGMGLSAHDFGAATRTTATELGSANSNVVTEQDLNDAPLFTLQWADPFGASGNDYDFFLLDAALSNVLASSTNTQNGNDFPIEFILSGGIDHSGNRLVVVKVAGDDVFIHVNTHRGRLEFATPGQIFGHPAAEGAMTVAAVNVATAGGGQFVGGPANPVEDFSSDGPRRIFFNPDGSPVAFTEGGPSSTVRQKPDITAADGVSTATPGFDPFFGTSASAPHSAAISALYKELFPSVSSESAYDLFRSSALDIEDSGFDRDSGAGIMMPEDALENTIFADGFESGDATSWTDSTP